MLKFWLKRRAYFSLLVFPITPIIFLGGFRNKFPGGFLYLQGLQCHFRASQGYFKQRGSKQFSKPSAHIKKVTFWALWNICLVRLPVSVLLTTMEHLGSPTMSWTRGWLERRRATGTGSRRSPSQSSSGIRKQFTVSLPKIGLSVQDLLVTIVSDLDVGRQKNEPQKIKKSKCCMFFL